VRLPPLFEIDAPAVRAAFRVSFMTWMVGAICLGIFPNEGKSAEPLVPGADSSLGLGATNEAIRQVAPGLFQIGNVRLDQAKRTITFPAFVNLREGPIEYVLVAEYGKIHESLLRTEVSPYSIQLALLLLDTTPAPTNATPAGQKSKGRSGARIEIEISWKVKKSTRRQRVGNFVLDRAATSTVGKGQWYFAGSRFREDGFAAQLDGSIITVIDDDDAIIGSRARNRDDDDNWLARGEGLPASDAPVEVVLRLVR